MKNIKYLALIVIVLIAASLLYFILTHETKTEYTVEIDRVVSCVTDVKKLTVPAKIDNKDIKVIGERAFYQNKTLISVELSEGIERVMTAAFTDCESLRTLTIAKTVTSIQPGAFENCPNFVKIEAGFENRVFDTVNGILYNKGKTELIYFPSGYVRADFYIPHGTLYIAEKAFYQANVNEVHIPETVLKVGAYAFSQNASMKKITFPNSLMDLEDHALDGNPKLQSITIGSNVQMGDKVTGNNSLKDQYYIYGAGTYVKQENDEWIFSKK